MGRRCLSLLKQKRGQRTTVPYRPSEAMNDSGSLEPPAKRWKYNIQSKDLETSRDGDANDPENVQELCDSSKNDLSLRQFLQPLPEIELADFTDRICWGKFNPYNTLPVPIVPVDTEPMFDLKKSPALCHHINAMSGRARACMIHLRAQPGQASNLSRPIPTPMFMPVGTKGCLKALTFHELVSDPALQCPIILANTYHLAIQPGTDLIDAAGGLHMFQGLHKMPSAVLNVDTFQQNTFLPYNLLTDSGGFQMVSLAKLSEVTEEGVMFENPYKKNQPQSTVSNAENDMLLLRPEDSIRHQNNIGANIIMALDDVISSASVNQERFQVATYRTLRWYDRCYNAHAKKLSQNLFPIVQGGLDTSNGGLREQCLAGFRHRELNSHYIIPGYAIGGLAGGEEKDDFWRVVDQCCRALPDDKPRYLMGVGYPLDLVVCTALGVDLYDCVYPTRTARFGVALVDGKAPGTLRLKGNDCATDLNVLDETCICQACHRKVTRATLARLFKAGNPVAIELLTQHNIAYMMKLVRGMRESIIEDRFANYARSFINMQYPGAESGGENAPTWVIDALRSARIDLSLS